jgi:hypothetical protein
MNCIYCNNKYIKKELKNHEETCEEKQLNCPLGCNEIIKKKYLKKHLLENSHSYQIIEKINNLENLLKNLNMSSKKIDSITWSVSHNSMENYKTKIKVYSNEFILKGYKW